MTVQRGRISQETAGTPTRQRQVSERTTESDGYAHVVTLRREVPQVPRVPHPFLSLLHTVSEKVVNDYGTCGT